MNTATPKLPEMNLTLIVRTMCLQHVYHFRRGDEALKALHRWDNDPFTVDVQLSNKVPDPSGKMEEVDTPFGRRLAPVLKDILVWRSTDTIPRWTTQGKKARLKAEAVLAQQKEDLSG
jgi:hypothetical protein